MQRCILQNKRDPAPCIPINNENQIGEGVHSQVVEQSARQKERQHRYRQFFKLQLTAKILFTIGDEHQQA